MSRIQISVRIAVSVISSFCLIWLVYQNASFLVAGLGIIEFRETDLIAMCLLSYALVRSQWKYGLCIASIGISIAVAVFTILTKGVIMFFSEDNWIAGWHATNFAAGCCLLVLTLESVEKAKKLKSKKSDGVGDASHLQS